MMFVKPWRRIRLGIFLAVLALASAACDQMQDQPRYEPYEFSEFWEDGTSARPVPANTVPRQEAQMDSSFLTGRSDDGELLQDFPIEVTLQVLERGQERYDIFCSPCHGLTGEGDGMIVQRGMPAPPSFHEQRLRDAPPGHYFDVITNGFGQMFAYGYRVPPADRWAITAYVRALQLSQNASPDSIPPEELERLEDGQ